MAPSPAGTDQRGNPAASGFISTSAGSTISAETKANTAASGKSSSTSLRWSKGAQNRKSRSQAASAPTVSASGQRFASAAPTSIGKGGSRAKITPPGAARTISRLSSRKTSQKAARSRSRASGRASQASGPAGGASQASAPADAASALMSTAKAMIPGCARQ